MAGVLTRFFHSRALIVKPLGQRCLLALPVWCGAGEDNRHDLSAFDFRIWFLNTDGALVSVPSPTAASVGATAVLPATGSEPRAGSSLPWAIAVARVAGGVTLLAGGAAVLRRTR